VSLTLSTPPTHTLGESNIKR